MNAAQGSQSEFAIPKEHQAKHFSIPIHGSCVVTCLLISHDRVITASDNHSICIHSLITGELLHSLLGHEGGVWCMSISDEFLVSGSTDRTIRIWDLATGRCKHVFGGHTSTVRCLEIVNPEWLEVEKRTGGFVKEKWPKRALIVTGSRDHSVVVWTLPRRGEMEYKCADADNTDIDSTSDASLQKNPYYRIHLQGHKGPVRSLAARGRTIVSGSFDHTVYVWDMITGACKWVLVGHTDKVYNVVLDSARNQVYSSSMDTTIRIWDLENGQCKHILTGHTSLVGLLGISPSYLVSAAADASLRVWDPKTGKLNCTFTAHTGAITCFQHDEHKVLSGSDGTLRMWNVKNGALIQNLLTRVTGVWGVAFKGRWCAAVTNWRDVTMLDVWDFENKEYWSQEAPDGMSDQVLSEAEGEDDDELGTPRIRKMTHVIAVERNEK